jgi:UDP-glucose 4-epimerase
MAELKGKKVLVSGGAGFIGYHLCNKLSQLTDDLTIYDNLSSGLMKTSKITQKQIRQRRHPRPQDLV